MSIVFVAAWACCTLSASAQSTNGAWAVNASGAWTDPANWTNGAVAGGTGAYALFTNATTDVVVTLPADGMRVGQMEFRAPSGNNNWAFTNGGPLTIDGPTRRFIMAKGTQRFYVPVVATNGFEKQPAGGGGTLSFFRSVTSTGRIDQLGGWITSAPELTEATVAEATVIEDFFTAGSLYLTSGAVALNAAAGKAASSSVWTLASGSRSVTSASTTNTSVLVAGQRVTGTGIPSGAFVSRIVGTTSFEISAAATADGASTLAFAAYYPASRTRIGTINTDNNGNGAAAELQVNNTGTQPLSVEVDKLIGGDNLRKSGTGMLQVRDLSSMPGSVRLDAGTLKINNPAQPEPAPATFPALHMDASALSTLTIGSGNTVTEWRDVNGSNTASVVSAASMNAPSYLASALNGRAMVDFGVFGGAGGSLGWAEPVTNIRAIFMVVGTQQKGGFLLGSYDTTGFSNIYDFHRGGPDGLQGTEFSHSLALGGAACAGFTGATLYMDGQRLSTTVDGVTGGYQLIEVMMSNIGRANAFCFDRLNTRNRAGGQRIGEVLLYTRALTETERLQTSAYLARKWFGKTLRAVPESSEMHQVVAKNSSPVNLQVTAGTRLTVDAIAGTKRVEVGGGGTAVLKNNALSGAQLVLRDGTLELPAAAGIPVPEQNPISNAFFHVDASAPGTVITDAAGRVLEWRDVDYANNGRAAMPPPAPATTAHYPDFRPNALNGLPLVDCGALYSGKCLLWNHTNTNIRTVFAVYGSLIDNLEAFIIGDGHNISPAIHFHRGIDGTVWYGSVHGSFKTAPVFVNGRIVDNGEKFVLPETPTVFSTVAIDMAGTPTASAFAVDRWQPGNLTWRTGGSTWAEYIIYTNRLSYSERRAVEAYLMRKWLKQPAPGYVLANNVRDGLPGLEVQATNAVALSVTGSGTVTVPDISGKGSISKTGNGTLVVGDTRNLEGTISVREGQVRFGGDRAVPTPSTLPGGLVFRLDASAAGSLEMADVGGTNYVSKVNDADARAFYAWATNDLVRPALIPNALNGLSVLDFGAYGSGRSMLWTQMVSTVRSVFWVIGSQNGGGFLLGCDPRYGTDDNYAHFHRGDLFNNVLGRIWRSNASANVRGGVTRLNGVPVNGEMVPLGGGFDLISLVTAGDTRASMFAGDRNFLDRTGGQMLAEVLVFTRALSALETRDVEAYLSAKWFGRIPGGYAGATPTASAVVTRDSGTLEVGADGLTVGGVDTGSELVKTGSGTLTVGGLSTVTGRVEVVEGGLAVGGALYANAPVTNGLIYHMDPSQTNTLLIAGDNSVTSMVSRVGNNVARRWAYQASFKGPLFLQNALNGLPVLDFGALGSGRFLELDQHVENMRSIFMIFGSHGGGGWLLGDKIADNNHRQFHRNNTGSPAGWGVYTTPLFEGGYADSANIHTYGVTRLDNTVINPKTTGFNGSYQIVEIHASSATHFQGHGFDRSRLPATPDLPDGNLSARSGGHRLGEVLAYDRLLTAAERETVYAYLRTKWMGQPVAGVRRTGTAVAEEIVVRTGAWVNLAGETVSTKSLIGGGAISDGSLSVTEVIAPGDTPGAVGTLSVSNITVAAGVLYEADYGGAASDTVTASGNLTLQGGGTVNLNLHGLLPPLNDITLFSFSSITDATNLSQWVITGDKPETYYLTLKRVNNTLQLVFLPQGTLIRIL
jgi:autotransporter-associated beta strand protein